MRTNTWDSSSSTIGSFNTTGDDGSSSSRRRGDGLRSITNTAITGSGDVVLPRREPVVVSDVEEGDEDYDDYYVMEEDRDNDVSRTSFSNVQASRGDDDHDNHDNHDDDDDDIRLLDSTPTVENNTHNQHDVHRQSIPSPPTPSLPPTLATTSILSGRDIPAASSPQQQHISITPRQQLEPPEVRTSSRIMTQPQPQPPPPQSQLQPQPQPQAPPQQVQIDGSCDAISTLSNSAVGQRTTSGIRSTTHPQPPPPQQVRMSRSCDTVSTLSNSAVGVMTTGGIRSTTHPQQQPQPPPPQQVRMSRSCDTVSTLSNSAVGVRTSIRSTTHPQPPPQQPPPPQRQVRISRSCDTVSTLSNSAVGVRTSIRSTIHPQQQPPPQHIRMSRSCDTVSTLTNSAVGVSSNSRSTIPTPTPTPTPQQRVRIIGGVWKGKGGTFVRVTPTQLISVLVDGVFPATPRSLNSKNVKFMTPPPPIRVRIIGGVHIGKMGTFVRYTDQRITIMIDGEMSSPPTKRHFLPTNVEFL